MEQINDFYALEVKIAGDILHKLEKHYPGHKWGACVDIKNGIATIRNADLSNEYGYLLHLADLDTDLHCVMLAGGEFLERYGVKRGEHDKNETNNLVRDISGEAKYDS